MEISREQIYKEYGYCGLFITPDDVNQMIDHYMRAFKDEDRIVFLTAIGMMANWYCKAIADEFATCETNDEIKE